MEGVRVEAKESQNPPAESTVSTRFTYIRWLLVWRLDLLTVGVENQEGERVSQDPLERPPDYHEQTAHEIVRPSRSSTITACAAPAHDVAREGRQGHDETEERQRCGIPKRLSQVAFDVVLGRQVDLLEELRGYGDGATALDAL